MRAERSIPGAEGSVGDDHLAQQHGLAVDKGLEAVRSRVVAARGELLEGDALAHRHTDYYDRSISCGGPSTSEGTAGVGAILIPGTPTTATPGGSIMNTCFPPNTNGEFTSSDRTGLMYLY